MPHVTVEHSLTKTGSHGPLCSCLLSSLSIHYFLRAFCYSDCFPFLGIPVWLLPQRHSHRPGAHHGVAYSCKRHKHLCVQQCGPGPRYGLLLCVWFHKLSHFTQMENRGPYNWFYRSEPHRRSEPTWLLGDAVAGNVPESPAVLYLPCLPPARQTTQCWYAQCTF